MLLKKFLEQNKNQYHQKKFISSDPLYFVYDYQNLQDQEIIGLICALLAYGNVAQIQKAIQKILQKIHTLAKSPLEFIHNLEDVIFFKQTQKMFSSFIYRFHQGEDLVLLFYLIHQSIRKFGSIGKHFSHYADSFSIEKPLNAFLEDWYTWAAKKNSSPHFWFFLTLPKKQSPCKRWCMYLRWMIRHDVVDPGCWTQWKLSPYLTTQQLILPLDTHVMRLSQYLQLTTKKTANWKTATEITQKLKEYNPYDPTCYDFSLSRLGILKKCIKKFHRNICNECTLFPVCHYRKITTT